MSIRDTVTYLEDIIKAMNDALRFIEDMSYDDFTTDTKTTYAVIRA